MTAGHALNEPEPAPIKRVLVADDDPQLRLMVQRILEKHTYEVQAVADGEQAVAAFDEYQPDLVLLDVMMPRLDGYETAQALKAQAGEQFVPIIFLTALSDEADLVRCLEAGGDGVLTKPFSSAFLQAEVGAMERMRKLYMRQQWQSEILRTLNAQVQREHEVAEQIFSHAVSSRNIDIPGLRSLIQPAATFNGDLLLSAYHPAGGLHIMLGDFTGHGLGAAIGALPVSEVFHTMTGKGYNATAILDGINYKLHTLMPSGIFLAAFFISLSADLRSLEVWNGGLPPAFLLDSTTGKIKMRLVSRNLPLGIQPHLSNNRRIERAPVELGDYLLAYSDGLIEARDYSGEELWGEDRLVQTIETCERAAQVFDAVVAALNAFTQGATQTDDVSLVGMPCQPELLAQAPAVPSHPEPRGRAPGQVVAHMIWSVELHGQEIAQANPITALLTKIEDMPVLKPHFTTLQTVIRELYNNAVDHGILQLDSHLKASAEGFEQFYTEREQRLQRLDEGMLRLEIALTSEPQPDSVIIRVQDSGKGFNPDHSDQTLHPESRFFGRGIPLVKNLCNQVRWLGRGNQVEAVYSLEAGEELA